MASSLYQSIKAKSNYYDKKSKLTQEQYEEALQKSSTVYVGNLSISCEEDSIYDLFSRCGKVELIKMGLNQKGEPAGFCFVIFSEHIEAHFAVEYLSHTKIENRIIRVDFDPGYQSGREYGRGFLGNQWRDTIRENNDPDRPNVYKEWQNQKRKQSQYNNRKHCNDDYSDKKKKAEPDSSDSENEDNYRRRKKQFD